MTITIEFSDNSFSPISLSKTSNSLVRTSGLVARRGESPHRLHYPYDTATTIKQRIHDHTGIPVEEMQLFWNGNDYYRQGEVRDSEHLQYHHRLRLRLERSPIRAYQLKSTKLAQSTKEEMVKQLKAIPIKYVDPSSIREIEWKDELSSELNKVKNRLVIYNLTDQCVNKTVALENEELEPSRLLPDHGGVECHGQFIGQYRAANLEMIHSIEEYEANLAHTKRLLDDLPIALANNQFALDEYMKENKTNPNYEEIATMTIERYRIRDEIETQKEKLKLLEANPIKIDPTKFVSYFYQTSVIFQFGLNHFNGKLYQVIELFSPDAIPRESVLPTILHPTMSPSASTS